MIPKINLDDRTFDDIFGDALKLIPRYCPEWTNHNTSDPGITLLELFSWMTEMTIYRLNKVPEKTYLSLLELMGLSLGTPQSARGIIQFFPVEGINKSINIKAGTQIAASVNDSADIIFETEKDINVKNNKLVSCINKFQERIKENINQEQVQEFNLFETINSVEHCLYICSESFKYLLSENSIQIEITPVADIVKESDQITRHLTWEYWDGEKWEELKQFWSINNLREKDNVLYISGNIPIQTLEINSIEGYWIRAVLTDVPEKESTLCVKAIKLKTLFGGKGFSPDFCIRNNKGQYSKADMNTSFALFSDNPELNETFYICADEIFKNNKVNVDIIYSFAETSVKIEDNKNALFIYEYWNGFDWVKLTEENNFKDGTFNLRQSGKVSFVVPDDIAQANVNNEEHFWIRIRLVTKDYATGGIYYKDSKDNWLWKFSEKVQSPNIEKIRIKYESLNNPPQNCVTYSNFEWNQIKPLTRANNEREIKVFSMDVNNFPSLYMGFEESFPDGEYSIYFKMNENLSVQTNSVFDSLKEDSLMLKKGKRGIKLVWEYFNGSEWKELSVNDDTDSFHESGFVSFVVPEDVLRTEYLGKNLYWYRVSLISGSFENNPLVKDILINSVYAKNEKSYQDEILGSGTGAPGQSVSVSHPNILKGSVLYVDEGSVPSTNELNMIAKDCRGEPYYTEDDKVWVRYTEVENFYASTSFSRHYVIDYTTGKIQFGDGSKGVNPPKGKFNILMKSYQCGGGSIGNVAKNTIRGLLKGIPFISGCTNPYPAEGGADMEKIDGLKARAAGSFKSLQRAVTSEDFKWLAMEASSSVGRAHCLKNRNSKNEICTIILPVRTSGLDYSTKLIPSRELIRRVKEYLDDRKIVGTPICVQGPVYKDFNIDLSLTFKSSVFDEGRTKKKIENILREYFDSLKGEDGNGWTFGKEITTGSILKQLEKVEEILSFNKVELFDLDANVMVEKILLKEEELPYLANVVITKR